MPAIDYIPATEDGFRNWANNFATVLQESPALFMMTPAECQAVRDAVDNFITAYETSIAPETRTKGTVAAKDDARSIAETLCRQYAILIKDNYGIDDESKIAAGVRPPNPERERIDPPTTQPLLNVLGGLPGTQTLRYADASTPESRGRPYGVVSMQLFRGIGVDELPVEQCQFYGNISRNPVDVEFTAGDDKKTATYYGRWVTARGEVGPMSLPVSLTIAA